MNYHREYNKLKMVLEASDPMNPDVSVPGLGTYDLVTLKANVRRQLQQLTDMVADDSPRVWRNAHSVLNDQVIQTKIQAVVQTHDDLQATRRQGGLGSRGINKE